MHLQETRQIDPERPPTELRLHAKEQWDGDRPHSEQDVSSVQDILDLGVYMTTAVKCGKTTYGIKTGTIKQCSLLLEQELALFPRVTAFLLMGDVAIRAVNYAAQRAGQARVIPAGSTYKIRGEEYLFRGARAFPSYLQAGPSFFIEKSKRKMIAEDIAAALSLRP